MWVITYSLLLLLLVDEVLPLRHSLRHLENHLHALVQHVLHLLERRLHEGKLYKPRGDVYLHDTS